MTKGSGNKCHPQNQISQVAMGRILDKKDEQQVPQKLQHGTHGESRDLEEDQT